MNFIFLKSFPFECGAEILRFCMFVKNRFYFTDLSFIFLFVIVIPTTRQQLFEKSPANLKYKTLACR